MKGGVGGQSDTCPEFVSEFLWLLSFKRAGGWGSFPFRGGRKGGVVFRLVVRSGGATTNCGLTEIFKNLRFEKWGNGWGWREVVVK